MPSRYAFAALFLCASAPSRAADLVFDLGAGYVASPDSSTSGYGLRGSIGLDFGIVPRALYLHSVVKSENEAVRSPLPL